MVAISSLTSKGQVVIPKQIRDQFGLKTRDRLQFSVDNGEIVARPIGTVEQFMGKFPGKSLSREEMKTLIAKRYAKKNMLGKSLDSDYLAKDRPKNDCD